MVGVTAVLIGYLSSQFWPNNFNGSISSPTLMIGFCILFSLGVSYIAYRGVSGSTGVAIAINIIQISALLVFSVIALGYRLSHMTYRWAGPRSRRQSDQRRIGNGQRRNRDKGRRNYKVVQEDGKDKPFIRRIRRVV
jgi:hypothetical protein